MVKVQCNTSKDELVHEVVELDRQVHSALRQYVTDAWMNLNLTIPQLKTLVIIARQGATNTKKIAVRKTSPLWQRGFLPR
jgi:hypothetical protein